MGTISGNGEISNNNNPYKFLELIQTDDRENKWLLNHGGDVIRKTQTHTHTHTHLCSDEKKLELRLGLPGNDDEQPKEGNNKWSHQNKTPKDGFIGYISSPSSKSANRHHRDVNNNNNNNNKHQQQHQVSFPAPPPPPPPTWSTTSGSGVYLKEPSQPGSSRVLQQAEDLADKNNRRKGFSPAVVAANNNSPVPVPAQVPPNISQKRSAPSPVVGWPPIRSFRKNLASSTSSSNNNNNSSSSLGDAKQQPAFASSDPQNGIHQTCEKKPKAMDNSSSKSKGHFVKINMDGVPIGRKVDLSAFDSYEKLSSSVDDLFRGLLAAQSDSCVAGEKPAEGKPITGLLDGNGEYTLVYEDDEGDRMLVGDVPWHMFVSNVKRLRVLKSSELPELSRDNCKERKLSNGSSAAAG